jgi:rare lipoprotein A
MKIRRVLAFPTLALVTLLTGCSSVPLGPGGASAPAPAAKSSKYYLNDGPLKGVSQATIDAIPEPVPRKEPLNKWAKKPYVAVGKEYVPMTELAPYRAQGIGSWYGTRYHGKKTSTGELYDMLKLTAAHPTLPLPCFVRVTNLENGRSIIVRVNDRGPFLHDRVIDLSFAAAARLGYVDKGSARVAIELVLP